MKSRSQNSGIRRQAVGASPEGSGCLRQSQGAGGRRSDVQTFRPSTLKSQRGFTLVEVLLALSISVFVFCAMGTLLVKTLHLWGDGAEQFHLAKQARSARARLLSGGLGPGTGLLSINEVTSIKTNPQWCTLDYQAAALDEKFTVKGSIDDDAPANKSVFVKSTKGGGQTWLTMVGIKRGQNNLPDVMATDFDVVQSNDTLIVRYILRAEFDGKEYEYPQVIQAYLVNL
jgi:prepilin-type N-terminal cleavage/methylation domain-containing protein